MRSDIVPGAIPDYELSDHTAKRRKLSEQFHRELEVGYCRLVTH